MNSSLVSIHLSEVCEVNPRDVSGLSPETPVTFVPMSAVDEKTGSIVKPEIRQYGDVAKGYTPFKNRDVLFAKITPCMENGKCAIARNLRNGCGFGSTEFHVLRARQNIIPEWIYYFLRQEKVRRLAANNFTGTAGQQRVPKSVFDKLLIPLPPLPIQKQIAAILEKADAAREKRRQANQLTKQFLQSAFLEMFGDPVTNPKGWKVSKLSELGSLERGRSKHRPRNAPFLLGGPYPLIQTGEIANSSGYITEYTQTYSERGLRQSKMWPRGTLCITIAANIAKTAILTFDACFPDSVVGFIPNDRLRTEYIQRWFSFVQNHLEESAPMVAQKNINLEILRKLDVPVPPIREQQKFAALVEKVESLRAKQRKSEKELENLFNSLMQRAFRGELVG